MFWECVYIVPIWTVIQDICYDAIDMEDFSMFKCLLSNFNSPLICVITALVKRYIHCCKHTGNSPCVSGYLIKLKKLRDLHHKKCTSRKNIAYYHKFWDILANDLFFNDLLKSWLFIDD